MTKSSYTTEERFWAAAAHVSLFIVLRLPFGIGLLAPITILYYKRRTSTWVGFQALQALTYQAIVWIVLVLILSFAGTAEEGQQNTPATIAFVFGVLSIFYALVGAFFCAVGRNFRYPLVGRIISRRLRLHED